MEFLKIPATGRTPEVDFDFVSGALRLRGEAYPDDVATFFGPIFAALRDYLARPGDSPVRFDMELLYFNSSSAKALMNLFQMLETAAAAGRAISVSWFYEEDDESMQELGEDFAEDLHHVAFSLRRRSTDGAP